MQGRLWNCLSISFKYILSYFFFIQHVLVLYVVCFDSMLPRDRDKMGEIFSKVAQQDALNDNKSVWHSFLFFFFPADRFFWFVMLLQKHCVISHLSIYSSSKLGKCLKLEYKISTILNNQLPWLHWWLYVSLSSFRLSSFPKVLFRGPSLEGPGGHACKVTWNQQCREPLKPLLFLLFSCQYKSSCSLNCDCY